jgi:hypothetical protein
MEGGLAERRRNVTHVRGTASLLLAPSRTPQRQSLPGFARGARCAPRLRCRALQDGGQSRSLRREGCVRRLLVLEAFMRPAHHFNLASAARAPDVRKTWSDKGGPAPSDLFENFWDSYPDSAPVLIE